MVGMKILERSRWFMLRIERDTLEYVLQSLIFQ
jgi:hypothetical protein